MNSVEEAKKVQDEIVRLRRRIHEHPELDDDLYKTNELVTSYLDDLGISYKIMAKTGVVGLIEGEQEGGTIAIRADMDALPIVEEIDKPYKSKIDGAMHACGHDAHTAILLGTAKALAENKDKIKGNVKLLFQPAEESFGGAETMIKEGAMEDPKVDAVIGLHVNMELGPGNIGVTPGVAMAAVDIFNIKINGSGCHAAAPHEGVDPILIAAETISSLQKIVSRELNPVSKNVVTVAEVKAGSASNIIPEFAHMQGTVRTTNDDERKYIEKRIKEIVEYTAKANRGTAEIDYLNHFPMVVNNLEYVGKLEKSVANIFEGQELVVRKEPTLGAEDMAYFLNSAPGVYFNLGVNNPEKGITYPLHHPKFDLDEDHLWKGAALFLDMVMNWQE